MKNYYEENKDKKKEHDKIYREKHAENLLKSTYKINLK